MAQAKGGPAMEKMVGKLVMQGMNPREAIQMSQGKSWGRTSAKGGGKKASTARSTAQTPANDASSGTEILPQKVAKTISWYNRHGGLQQPIDINTVEESLNTVGEKEA